MRRAPDGKDLAWLDWNALNDTTHPESAGRSLVFMSGLTADSHGELATTTEQRAHHERLTAGVKVNGRTVRFQRISDDCERIARVAFPEEVLIGRTLEAQAASLGAWIVEGFQALSDVPGLD